MLCTAKDESRLKIGAREEEKGVLTKTGAKTKPAPFIFWAKDLSFVRMLKTGSFFQLYYFANKSLSSTPKFPKFQHTPSA